MEDHSRKSKKCNYFGMGPISIQLLHCRGVKTLSGMRHETLDQYLTPRESQFPNYNLGMTLMIQRVGVLPGFNETMLVKSSVQCPVPGQC